MPPPWLPEMVEAEMEREAEASMPAPWLPEMVEAEMEREAEASMPAALVAGDGGGGDGEGGGGVDAGALVAGDGGGLDAQGTCVGENASARVVADYDTAQREFAARAHDASGKCISGGASDGGAVNVDGVRDGDDGGVVVVHDVDRGAVADDGDVLVELQRVGDGERGEVAGVELDEDVLSVDHAHRGG
jgi:hypothetical protein